MSQEEFAWRVVGMSRATVSNFEMGTNVPPPIVAANLILFRDHQRSVLDLIRAPFPGESRSNLPDMIDLASRSKMR